MIYDKFLRGDRKEIFSKIRAHTRTGYPPETLQEHSLLTLKYFGKLLSDFRLNGVIDNLVSEVFPDDSKEIINEFIRYVIFCHDIGKISPVFQEKLKNNISIKTTLKNTHHSRPGFIMFISLAYNQFRGKIKDKNLVYLMALASIINGHHTRLNNLSNIFQDEDLLEPVHQLFIEFFDTKKTTNGKFGDKYIYQIIKGALQKLESNKGKNSDDIERRESFFYLYKLLYSLLVISDYYATLDFKKGIVYSYGDFNLLSTIKDKIINNFYNNSEYPYNSGLLSEETKNNIYMQDYSSIQDVNLLRTKILHDANRYLNETDLDKKRIFYLRLPTGSGKTNISISIAINMIKKIENINRVYYVFPFINIIEQNYNAIKETLQLNENEISEIYCDSEWLEKEESRDEEWRYYLNNEFLNYPINIMSNVNFFNTFIKSGKAQNYKLHNLANSLVIIDEIQSLNDKDWTMFLDFIAFSSRKLNIYYVIMSATLPRLNNLLKEEEKFANSFFSNLFPEKIESHIFNHPKFKNRVTLRLRHDVQTKEKIIDLLEENISRINPIKILIVVNTVVDSLNLYRIINDWNKKQVYTVFLLNSTILPFRRKKIIQEIKSSNKNIILVSTQSVEAGVDIDCDYGIRDFAIFDSIEQAAGRINRNCNRDASFLDIVLLKENDKERWSVIYGNSERGQILKEQYFNKEALERFMKERNILDYYDKVISMKKDKNDSKIQQNDRDTIESIRNMKFETLTTKNVISQSSVSFFVPLNLTGDFLKEYPHIFSPTEKDMLKSLDINIVGGLDTKLLWDCYIRLRDEDNSVIDKKINLKKFNSIITKFMFSVSCNKQLIGSISNQGINLLDQNKFNYGIENGLDIKELRKQLSSEAEFW